MGGWEVLLILLVPLGVWIISSVFRGEDEQPQTRSRSGDNVRLPVQRRMASDLDRFLEEARRRREALKGNRPSPPEPPPAPPRPDKHPVFPRETRPVPAPAPQPSRLERQPLRKPKEDVAPRSVPVPVLVELVLDKPAPKPAAVPRAELPAPPSPAPTPPLSSPSSSPTPATLTLLPSTSSPGLTQLKQMLNTPQTAGTAFVLREIFDRPLSQRRR